MLGEIGLVIAVCLASNLDFSWTSFPSPPPDISHWVSVPLLKCDKNLTDELSFWLASGSCDRV